MANALYYIIQEISRPPVGGRLRITVDFPAVILHNDLAVVLGENIVVVDRDLPSAARRVDHKFRNGVAGDVPGEGVHDQTRRFTDAERT